MKNRIFSFSAALVIHLLILLALYYSLSKKSEFPQTTPLSILILGEVNKTGKSVVKSVLYKDQQHGSDYHIHSSESDLQSVTKSIAPTFNPLPQIPDDLREEAFVSDAIARFFIDASGNVARVELIKPCANPRLNNLLLKSLKMWKFSAASKDSTQDIRVNFKVE